MFPISTGTIFEGMILAMVLLSALAWRSPKPWRRALLALAVALPVVFLLWAPFEGPYAGLGGVIVILIGVAALVLGAILSRLCRWIGLPRRWSTPLLMAAALAVTGFALWSQFVPQTCRTAPLETHIADQVLTLPGAFQPWLRRDGQLVQYGNLAAKSGFARLCRLSENGTEAVDADEVILFIAALPDVEAQCEAADAPDWCSIVRPETLAAIDRLTIAPTAQPAIPEHFWTSDQFAQQTQGTRENGSLCHLSTRPGDTPRCWITEPFGDTHTLTIATRPGAEGAQETSPEDVLALAKRSLGSLRTALGQ